MVKVTLELNGKKETIRMTNWEAATELESLLGFYNEQEKSKWIARIKGSDSPTPSKENFSSSDSSTN